MQRHVSRFIVAAALIACGGIAANAQLFSSGDKESKADKDLQEIRALYKVAAEAEEGKNYEKAVELYNKTIEKTFAYDKAYPKEDPAIMQLIRTYCNLGIQTIETITKTTLKESTTANTPAAPPATADPLLEGIEVPSRTLDGSAHAQPDTAAPAKPAGEPVSVTRVLGDLEKLFTPPKPADPVMTTADKIAWARDKMQLDEPAEAMETLREVLAADVNNPSARFLFALASLQCDEGETAELFLTGLTRDAPSEAVFLLLGALHYHRHDFNAAIDAVRKAIELNPASAAARINEAIVLLDMPGISDELRRETATTTYRRALVLGAARDAALEARLGIQ